MSVVHIHLRHDLIDGDVYATERRIADDVADSIARHLKRGRRGSPRDLVTVVFHEIDPECSLVEDLGDETRIPPLAEDPRPGRLKSVVKRIKQAAGRPAGAVAGAGRVVARRAQIAKEEAAANAQRADGEAVAWAQHVAGAPDHQMELVGGETYARFSEFGAVLDEAIKEQTGKLGRDPREIRENAAEWCKATAASVSAAFMMVEQMVPSFSDLAPAVKAKFAMAGLRGAWRPIDVAQGFFKEGVPAPVRNLGEDAVVAFVKGKHASHIRPVARFPQMMMDHSNIVWERAKANLARGAANMDAKELAKANALNALDATGIVMNQAIRTAATAGCVGMALEGVVSIAENSIYVYKGKKEIADGAKETAQEILKKGGLSALGGAGWMVALALGAGPAISAAGPVLVTVGGATFLVTAYKRVKEALDSSDEHPESNHSAPALHGPPSGDVAISDGGDRPPTDAPRDCEETPRSLSGA